MGSEKQVVNDVMKMFNNGWSKQVILYGPPGTSKTYSATIIAALMLLDKDKKIQNVIYEEWMKKLIEDANKKGISIDEKNDCEIAEEYLKCKDNNARYKLVQFHPSYSYEDFVRGISIKKGGGYEAESKIFEKFCDAADKAQADKDGKKPPFVLVIDEINRAPLGSVLGELIYGLEYRGKEISTSYTVYDNNNEKKLVVPDNLYIIGTMNTADRSIGSMDYAVRRRFAFVQVPSTPEVIESTWTDGTVKEMAKNLYDKLITEKEGIFSYDLLVDKEMDVEDIKIGHTYFLGKKGSDDGAAYLAYRVKYQIYPIYQEYMKDGLIDQKGKHRFGEIVMEVFKGKNDELYQFGESLVPNSEKDTNK